MAENNKLQTSNRWSTRQLVVMALFVALSVILSFIEIPLPFLAPFLKYDASFVPAIIGSLIYGAAPGAVIGVLASAIHMLVYGDIWGGVMNIIAVLGVTIPAGLIYKGQKKSGKRLVVALVVGSICSIILALLGDLLVIPIYMGVDVSVVVAMLPVLALFNLIKVVANALLSALVLKPVESLAKRKK